MRPITTRNVTVNTGKVITIVLLLALPLFYPVETRQAAYLAMHVSYCVWYLAKQAIVREPVFREQDTPIDFVVGVAVVGVFYALPGWLAFMNSEPVTNVVLAASIVLFFFGSLLNSSADVQKTTALRLQKGLITDGFWGLSRNINYFGDVLRYSAFALLSGSPWSWSVVLTVLAIDVGRMRTKQASLARHPGFAAYRDRVPALVPFTRLPFARKGPAPVPAEQPKSVQ